MLVDRFGRTIDYVRISVTDRCDLRCTYCIPKGFKNFEVHDNWLTFDEIFRVVSAFARLGVRRFRLTGGEPLLRKDVVSLVETLKSIEGVDDLSMTTNATQLAKYAKALSDAGLDRLNISLDALTAGKMKSITGFDCYDNVINGIITATEQKFSQIKINMVLMPNVNEDEIESMIAFCIQHQLVLRMIEVMPMGNTGRETKGVNLSEFLSSIHERYGLVESDIVRGGGPARYWVSKNCDFTLGLITPMSQHFCETCNRIRLAVDGTLYMCLGQNESYPLRELLREKCSEKELEQAIRDAIELKPEKHEFNENANKINRIMSMTGG